ncbi:SDR family oxidoreductase [Brevundimonas sp.]|uniref:SDR family oxidoreductase n=1 Tax=Brevundimonas sp. TaxID=1871086 RepID=UPI001DB959E1|nr:SDR family oxidoreductase [Brevundimonas sp.]MBA3999577.1 NADH-ubiquinone oxidoreductase [Brevundimonas sp.]
MRVLVLGATGLIGAHIAARLQEQGHQVIAGGRDRRLLERRFSDRWVHADLAQADEARWTALLRDVNAVVNCAGALQDSLRDDLAAVHDAGVRALLKGCAAAGVKRYVHISAAGLAEDRTTAFNRTKLAGEAAVRASGLNWIILRPGLVLAPTAYGGSALLRALAAFPLAIPAAWPDRVVQVIGMNDLGRAVEAALRPDAPRSLIVDVLHDERLPLGDLLRRLRRWLGHAPAPVLTLPGALARLSGQIADALGWLGWRSPMRTASLEQLRMGVTGDGTAAERHLGVVPGSLDAILNAGPAGVQERWFATLYLMKPALIGMLAAFWFVSGVIGLVARDSAEAVLIAAGLSHDFSRAAVVGGSLVDLALGAAVLFRPWTRLALLGMIAVTAVYLAGATLFRPDLWLDPLGSLLKTLPAAVLALVALAILDER